MKLCQEIKKKKKMQISIRETGHVHIVDFDIIISVRGQVSISVHGKGQFLVEPYHCLVDLGSTNVIY